MFPDSELSRRRLLRTALAAPLLAAAGPGADRAFTTSDGVRLHYIEDGSGRTIVFVPGWTMPAWIWTPQLEGLKRRWRVVALDPRSQGSSEIARSGHEPRRRGRDIAELLDRLGPGRVVLVGWSLGVLDSLAYLAEFGDRRIAGLVLVDNSVGEGQAPPPGRPSTFLPALRRDRDRTVRAFVRAMYKTPQDPSYLEAVTQASLRTPLQASIELLSYPRPREFWRELVYSTQRPVLYVIRPRLAGQGRLLAEKHADATVEVFEEAGHALFVDEAARFNALLDEFLVRKARWS